MNVKEKYWQDLEKKAKHEYPEELQLLAEEAEKFVRSRTKEDPFVKTITFQKYFLNAPNIKDSIKRAGYYEFFIVKKPFMVKTGNSTKTYFSGEEIRPIKERTFLRNYLKLCDLKFGDHIRVIKAPNKANRLVQYHFYQILQIFTNLDIIKISENAHGFVNGRNAKTGALEHTKFHMKRYQYLQNLLDEEELTDEHFQEFIMEDSPFGDLCRTMHKFVTMNNLEENGDFCNKMSENKGYALKENELIRNKLKEETSNCITISPNNSPELYSYNFDIEDFFPSITKDKLFNFVKSLINARIAKALCKILTIDGKLVQGSILSPIITNIYFYWIDVELSNNAISRGICYTRYADDITISSTKPIPKSFINKIFARLRVSDFKIKNSKTERHTNIIWCTGLFVKWYNTNCTNTIYGKPVKCSSTIPKSWKFDWFMEIRIKRSAYKKAIKTIETFNRICKFRLKQPTIQDCFKVDPSIREEILMDLKHPLIDEDGNFSDNRPISAKTGKTRYNLARGYFAYIFYAHCWVKADLFNDDDFMVKTLQLLNHRGRTLLGIDKRINVL